VLESDGGVARLRVYGDVVPDPDSWADVTVELSGVEQGGRVEWSSDDFYSNAWSLIAPNRPRNMGDGWEARRRRDVGPDSHDAVMISFAGGADLRKQIENLRIHGVSPVVAINVFPTDHQSEHAAIREIADSMGARSALCTHFAEGGKGAVELATAVAEAAEEPSEFAFLYPHDATLREKILTVALRVYGAQGVEYDVKASQQLESYERNGFGKLPVCIAKTHLSISSDPALKGAPTGWVLPGREARASVGAGVIYPIGGNMRTMPGLPTTPIAASIDIDEKGQIVGLS